MGFFNNSTKIIPASGSVIGVLMPYSDKVLTVTEIDAKIQKAKGEIDYLTKGLASRITHGGKRFRARQISIKSRIGLASERLTLLASAKAIIEVEWEKRLAPTLKVAQAAFDMGPSAGYTVGATGFMKGHKMTVLVPNAKNKG